MKRSVLTMIVVTVAAFTSPATDLDAAETIDATRVVSAGERVRVREAPAAANWRQWRPGGRGWRTAALPVRVDPASAGRDLLVRRVLQLPAGTAQLAIQLSTPSRARLWLDTAQVGQLGPGGGRITLQAEPGRHLLALRLRQPQSRALVRLRVVAYRASAGGAQPEPSTTIDPTTPVVGPSTSPGSPTAVPSPSPDSSGTSSESPSPSPESPSSSPSTSSASPSEPVASEITRVCRINDPRLPEISGLAAGVTDPSVLWVHNDSGDSARIFALDRTTCAVRAEVRLADVTATDIEGIAMGRAEDGTAELWVGDIGDNSARRASVRLYRLPEPTVADQTVPVNTVTVTWTGGARNCESIAVDPVPGGAVYLVSKQASGAGVFSLVGDYRNTGLATTGGSLSAVGNTATDAAIAPDRSRSVIRYYSAAEMRTGVLPGSSPVHEAMPDQRQGEAITFAPDSQSVYLASEGPDDLIRVPLQVWGQ